MYNIYFSETFSWLLWELFVNTAISCTPLIKLKKASTLMNLFLPALANLKCIT